MKYDLTNLDSRSFENLCADIIEKQLNTRAEVFSAGKDGGIDGRFWVGEEKKVVLQAKHRPLANSTEVKRIAIQELDKIKKVNPEKYIFLTSGSVTKDAKDKIKEKLNPYVSRQDDIWGGDEIQRFLSKEENFDIVLRYTQLYINSSQIIRKVLGDTVRDLVLGGVKGRSKFLFEYIKENAKKFVLTNDFESANKKLINNNVVIITGEAGIGKTYLSNMLAFEYVKKGFEFYSVSDIREAETVLGNLSEKRKIVFYYDDFLGENFARFIRGNEGSDIVKFIERVKLSSHTKLILNSRTTVLNRAVYNNHSLLNGKIRKSEYLLTIKNLTNLEKAMMLYKHMYFSSLSPEYVDEIYNDKKYRKIIKHRNFSPRIIEYILDKDRINDLQISHSEYFAHIEKSLEEPRDIWLDYFEKINDCTKKLIFLITFNQNWISETELKSAYLRYLETNNLTNTKDSSFNYAITEAANSLIERKINQKGEYFYTLFNPSVGDYILKEYFKNAEIEAEKLVFALRNMKSLRYLISLSDSGYLSKRQQFKILKKVFTELIDEKLEEGDIEWLLFIVNLDEAGVKKAEILRVLNYLVDHTSNEVRDFNGGDFYKIYHLLQTYSSDIVITNYEFLWCFINNSMDSSDFEYIFKYIVENEVEDDELKDYLAEKYIEFVTQNIDDYLDIDYQEYVHIEKDGGYAVDKAGLRQEVSEAIERNFLTGGVFDDFFSRTSFDVSEIKKEAGDVINNNAINRFEDAFASDYQFDDYKENRYVENIEIDEIFNR